MGSPKEGGAALALKRAVPQLPQLLELASAGGEEMQLKGAVSLGPEEGSASRKLLTAETTSI
jgi:hypothetical protein